VAFTYVAPDASDKDEVRFYLQDTDPGFPLLQDEEIQWLITEWMPKYDSLIYVASVGAAVIANKFVGLVSVATDGVSVGTQDLAQRYRDMAAALRDQYKAAQIGADINIDNLLIGHSPDPSIRPLRFGVGLHDNPEAGQQDYGGQTADPFLDAAGYPW
jgi:hypothetical protein